MYDFTITQESSDNKLNISVRLSDDPSCNNGLNDGSVKLMSKKTSESEMIKNIVKAIHTPQDTDCEKDSKPIIQAMMFNKNFLLYLKLKGTVVEGNL
uniref:Uncharacterized protein n=1 Tax=Rhabditophanes sp. KR3021 TaxID=114890 RepID=A0AC35U8U2_9BILA